MKSKQHDIKKKKNGSKKKIKEEIIKYSQDKRKQKLTHNSSKSIRHNKSSFKKENYSDTSLHREMRKSQRNNPTYYLKTFLKSKQSTK